MEEKYYLSSMESEIFGEPRKCDYVAVVPFNTGKTAIIAKLSPPVIGQTFGLGGKDIEFVVLSGRHEGEELYPISSFPCFVYICHFLNGDLSNMLPDQLVKEDLQILAWGELYRTERDATDHVFD